MSDDLTPLLMIGGVRYLVRLQTKEEVVSCASKLITCFEHDGSHHFVVTHEGMAVAVSETGLDCLGPLLDKFEAESEQEEKFDG